MSLPSPVLETTLPGMTLHRRGKVRDIYEAGDDLLIITTDRISAFDVILGSGIPDKGKVLTQLSAFWFSQTEDIVANHFKSIDVASFPQETKEYESLLRGRSMLVQRTRPLQVECVARGYISGSGWKEYQQTGRVCGITLPAGLRESEQLPEPIFTPATKAETGHDINISEEEAGQIVGQDLITRLRDLTLELYTRGAKRAKENGIIVADTKFEFGVTGPDEKDVILIDEVLTPDSSRFWPADQYQPGGSQPSFDKQYVRDYLESINWNKQPPAPTLPTEVTTRSREKYCAAYRLITGLDLES